jgi:hypothetical protein
MVHTNNGREMCSKHKTTISKGARIFSPWNCDLSQKRQRICLPEKKDEEREERRKGR